MIARRQLGLTAPLPTQVQESTCRPARKWRRRGTFARIARSRFLFVRGIRRRICVPWLEHPRGRSPSRIRYATEPISRRLHGRVAVGSKDDRLAVKNLLIVAGLALLWMTAVFGRLAYLQLFRYSEYHSRAQQQQQRDR